MVDIGDFSVPEYSLQLARDRHGGRSEESRAIDREKRAPVTTDYQTWANDMDDLDYPGIDTPSENPAVLPKDLRDPAATDLTSQARDEEPAETMQVEGRELAEQELGQTDISLAPEEAFEGVAATSSREFGGFNSTYEGEESPLNETIPPDFRE